MTRSSLLIGDIGGTNARFALASPDVAHYSSELLLPCAEYESAQLAIDHFLKKTGAGAPQIICLAVAGPVVAQKVRFTNNRWSLDASELARKYPGSSVRLLNDFEAIAYSIPFLGADDSVLVGLPDSAPLPADNYTLGIIGPGTGLGAVGLKRVNKTDIAIAGEAGHIGFAPATRVQLEILTALRDRFDRVSSERLVCGPGLENLYWALGRVHGQEWPQLSAEKIFAAAASGADSKASEAVQLFFEILGQVAGDFALTIGAVDGIFIAGGIVPRYPEMFANSRFRSGFENKGRYRSMMESIPTRLILHAHPGLLGAAAVAQQMAQA
ncbi:MAG: glucokinase [Gammaproteobacteria bacterium]|nr:glucokinase [Gammaproteobacteria bacterium]MDH5304739.1 glucokinase [Gammaproteobacteria bacterium]